MKSGIRSSTWRVSGLRPYRIFDDWYTVAVGPKFFYRKNTNTFICDFTKNCVHLDNTIYSYWHIERSEYA